MESVMNKDYSIFNVLIPWAAIAAIIGISIAAYSADEPLGTNEFRKVAWVNENGQVNCPEVIATVAQQTTNETKVVVAEQAARSAEESVKTTTNAVKKIISQMTENDVHIYRNGNLISFEALVSWDPERDMLAICEFATGGGNQHIGYVATQDIGTTKPRIKFSDTILTPTSDWGTLSDSSVSAVTIHNETKMYRGVEYSKWYSVEATDAQDTQHFYMMEMTIDNPEGDGMTLNIAGGFTGGYTGTVVDGSLRKTYKGGILMGCEYVE